MKINFNTQNFTGYKNLIHTDISSKDGRFVMLAMQLDDTGGYEDLAELKKLHRFFDLPETDVLTYMQVQRDNVKPCMIIDNMKLLDGFELKLLNSPKMAAKLSEENIKKTERFNFKAYTLLASLTKRLMNISMSSNDEGFKHTVQEVSSTLKEIFPSVSYVISILNSAFEERKPFQKTALELNTIIRKNMDILFK